MDDKADIKQILSKRRVYFAILICLSIIGFIYWKELQTNSQGFIQLSWTGQAFFYLFLGLVMMAFRDLAYMIRIRILTDKKLSWKQAFDVIMLWEFASAISPGVVGGSALAIFILEKEKIPIGKSTALVIVTLILDNFFYILFIPSVFLAISMNSLFPQELDWMSKTGTTIFWFGYSIIFIITLILVMSIFFSPKIIHFFVRLVYKLPFLRKRKEKAVQFGKDIELTSQVLKNKSPLFWLKLFGTTIWSWTARFLVVNCVLFAFIEMELTDHLVILARQLIMWLAMLVTPTPGGSGMAEFAFSELFSDYVHYAGLSALGLAVIWRTLSYYPYLLIGSIILPKWLKK